MDNFTHSLAGWVLGQTGLKRKSRKGLAALILGANAPDLDVFLGWVPYEPLATHRGITHSLVVGVPLLALGTAVMLWLIDRWQVRRGASFRSGLEMSFGWLVALALLGTLSHPFLDAQTTYSVQLFSPFSGGWWHSDSLFIIDAVLWVLLPLAIGVSRWRERHGGNWKRPARLGVGVALTYIGANALLSHAAAAEVRSTQLLRRPDAVFASPPPVLFWQRTMTWDAPNGYRQASYSIRHGLGRAGSPTPNGLDHSFVRQLIATNRRARDFLHWSTMPMAEVTQGRCADTVTLGDARYLDLGGKPRLTRVFTLPHACASKPRP